MDLLIQYSIPVSIVVRIISCLMLLFFCIPLQLKELHVRNGLRVLRIQLLAFGIILFLTNVFSLDFLWLALATAQKPINAFLQLVNAGSFLALSVIGHLMYHSNYSDENKEQHARLEEMEKTGQKIS